jgi:hypothetical protein
MAFHFGVDVLTMVTINTTIFWDVMQFSTEFYQTMNECTGVGHKNLALAL